MINVMGGVPDWMGGTHIDPQEEDYWVRMISSMVYYGRVVKRLDFTLLGPMNEQDWNGIEGPQVDPQQYVRLLHKLSDRLDSLGLSEVRFVGPDAASTAKATSGYLPALEADGVVMAKMAYLGIHSYDGSSGNMAQTIAGSAFPRQDFWVTEFSGPCPGCDEGAPNPADWDSARATAADAISLLQQGAAGLQFYDAWDGFYEHHASFGYWGALAYDAGTHSYTQRKAFYVLKQLITYVPRNAVRVAVESSDDSVDAIAFVDPSTGRITIFAQNTGATSAVVRLSVPGAKGSAVMQNYRTDLGANMQKEPDVRISAGITTVKAAADSVFTLTGITK
jgi:O-glycosyl hydrolase